MLFPTVNATAVGTVKDRISGRSFFRKVARAHETKQRLIDLTFDRLGERTKPILSNVRL